MLRCLCLLFVALATAPLGSQAEVVTDFNPKCNDFFYMGKEPAGIAKNAVKICQRYKGKYYYASLYSTQYRIPLYSAYTFNPSSKVNLKAMKNIWFIEPQLHDRKSAPDMTLPGSSSEQYCAQQAVNKDYEFSGFDRGQLNSAIHHDEEINQATFTLTNAVPTVPCFNRMHWNKWKKSTVKLLDSVSNEGTTYVVTGAVPTDKQIPMKSEFDEETNRKYHRVSIPSHIWTAVCYRHISNKSKSFSFAYIGTNEERPIIKAMSIAGLMEKLAVHYKSRNIRIFEDECDGSSPQSQEILKKYRKGELSKENGFYMSQRLKMVYDASRSSYGISHNSGEIPNGNYPYIRKIEIVDQSKDIKTWFQKVEELKKETKTVCVLDMTFVLSEEKHEKVGGELNALENRKNLTCLMLPEKSAEGSTETADGTRCVQGETCANHECNTSNGKKKCCSTPCLYVYDKKAFMCRSGSEEIDCSPQYSLVTNKGTKCKDEHMCGTYGYSYYWCWTKDSWNYCTPPYMPVVHQKKSKCRSDHPCGTYGYKYYWCYIDYNNNWRYCCGKNDQKFTVSGKYCLPTYPCNYYSKSYLWCYTTDGGWDYCCNQTSVDHSSSAHARK